MNTRRFKSFPLPIFLLVVLALSVLVPAAAAAEDEPATDGDVRNVAILVFEGVQIIDFAGPYEVFGQGRFNVYTVSETGEPLDTTMELTIDPRYSFEDAPEPDVLIVPGGAAHVAFEDPELVSWVRQTAARADHVLSVCNGAFVLAKAGLLDGLTATTFHKLIDELREFAPDTEVVDDRRFVDNGKIVTSAGLSAGLDASLHVLGKIQGLDRARKTAHHLEYDWRYDDVDSGDGNGGDVGDETE